jgi:hypothetical protein
MSCRRPVRLVALLVAAGVALSWSWWWRRRAAGAASAPVPTTTFTPIIEPAPTTTTAEPWVPPVDGECPDGYPVKVNESSGIYHVPGGRFYDRASPQRCYATAEQAEADGYRRAKA